MRNGRKDKENGGCKQNFCNRYQRLKDNFEFSEYGWCEIGKRNFETPGFFKLSNYQTKRAKTLRKQDLYYMATIGKVIENIIAYW